MAAVLSQPAVPTVAPVPVWIGRCLRLCALAGLAALVALLEGLAGSPWAPGPGKARAQDTNFFRIATGTTGGTYFPIGGLISNVVSGPPGLPSCPADGPCGVPGLIAVAQVSDGSLQNIELLREKRVEAILVQADIAFWAYTGTGQYAEREPFEDLRAIGRLYPELIHIVVAADSDIARVPDLAGRRVGLGPEGSGTLVNMRRVLAAYGLSEAEIEPYYLRPEPGGDRLRAGDIDAFGIVGGVPLLAVADLARRLPIRVLSFEDRPALRMIEEEPFLSLELLPEGTYAGVPAALTPGVGALLAVDADLDEGLVHALTRALWHPGARSVLVAGHPRGADLVPEEALSGLPIPLHPGAERYYREIDLLPHPESGEDADDGEDGAGEEGSGGGETHQNASAEGGEESPPR